MSVTIVSVTVLSVTVLSVTVLSVTVLSVTVLSVTVLSVTVLSVTVLSVTVVSVTVVSVTVLSVTLSVNSVVGSVNSAFVTDERSNALVCYFLFSVVWSVGATLDGPSRMKFDEFFRSLCEMEGASATYPR